MTGGGKPGLRNVTRGRGSGFAGKDAGEIAWAHCHLFRQFFHRQIAGQIIEDPALQSGHRTAGVGILKLKAAELHLSARATQVHHHILRHIAREGKTVIFLHQRQRQVEIQRILPDEPVVVEGDRMRIEQVIVNLLRNALDATKAVQAPKVEVMLAADDKDALTVRDNGPGIEDLDALFEPFYTTKQAGDGVGLGLAISSGIVNDLGGRLTARNGQAGGAVFEMELPLMGDDEKIEAAE